MGLDVRGENQGQATIHWGHRTRRVNTSQSAHGILLVVTSAKYSLTLPFLPFSSSIPLSPIHSVSGLLATATNAIHIGPHQDCAGKEGERNKANYHMFHPDAQ